MDNFKLIKFTDGDISLDVRVSVEDGTIWLSANEMAILFKVAATTIRRIIKSTYNVDDTTKSAINANNASFASMVVHLPKKKPFIVYGLEVIKTIGLRFNNNAISKLESFVIKSLNTNDNNNIIIYNNGSANLNVSIDPNEETVWLSQEQIATLFNTTQQNVSLHIKNILEEGELEIDSVHKDFLYTAKDNKQYYVSHYNLDLILAVGYRIKGRVAIDFRKWVTKILKSYIINGAAINDEKNDSIFYKGLINLNNQYAELKSELEALKANNYQFIEKEKIFFNGEYFDAFDFICNLLGKAKTNIKIVDPYFDRKGLSFLKRTSPTVEKKIFKSDRSKLLNIDLQKYESQYGKITLKTINNFHDRFIIIDDELCYALGTSLNTMGKRVFAVNQIETKGLVEAILSHLN